MKDKLVLTSEAVENFKIFVKSSMGFSKLPETIVITEELIIKIFNLLEDYEDKTILLGLISDKTIKGMCESGELTGKYHAVVRRSQKIRMAVSIYVTNNSVRDINKLNEAIREMKTIESLNAYRKNVCLDFLDTMEENLSPSLFEYLTKYYSRAFEPWGLGNEKEVKIKDLTIEERQELFIFIVDGLGEDNVSVFADFIQAANAHAKRMSARSNKINNQSVDGIIQAAYTKLELFYSEYVTETNGNDIES